MALPRRFCVSQDRDDSVDRLLNAVIAFTEPLRMGDGIDEPALAELKAALVAFAAAWKGDEMIPKDAATVLAELYPAMDGSTGLYASDYAKRIYDEAIALYDLVAACMASE
jgi:hypothetical protein